MKFFAEVVHSGAFLLIIIIYYSQYFLTITLLWILKIPIQSSLHVFNVG